MKREGIYGFQDLFSNRKIGGIGNGVVNRLGVAGPLVHLGQEGNTTGGGCRRWLGGPSWWLGATFTCTLGRGELRAIVGGLAREWRLWRRTRELAGLGCCSRVTCSFGTRASLGKEGVVQVCESVLRLLEGLGATREH